MTNEKIKLNGLELYVRRIEQAESGELWCCFNMIDGKTYIQCSPEVTQEEIKKRIEEDETIKKRLGISEEK